MGLPWRGSEPAVPCPRVSPTPSASATGFSLTLWLGPTPWPLHPLSLQQQGWDPDLHTGPFSPATSGFEGHLVGEALPDLSQGKQGPECLLGSF